MSMEPLRDPRKVAWRAVDGLHGTQRLDWREPSSNAREEAANELQRRKVMKEEMYRARRVYDGRIALISSEGGVSIHKASGLVSSGSNTTPGWSGTSYDSILWQNTLDHTVTLIANRLSHVGLVKHELTANGFRTWGLGMATGPKVLYKIEWVDSTASVIGSASIYEGRPVGTGVSGYNRCYGLINAQATIPDLACGLRLRTDAWNFNSADTCSLVWDAEFDLVLLEVSA